jgi:hypothetical protein
MSEDRGKEQRLNTNGVCSRHKDMITELNKCYEVVIGWTQNYNQRMDTMLNNIRSVTQEQIDKCVKSLEAQFTHINLTVENNAIQAASNASAITGIRWAVGILVVVALGVASLLIVV